MPIIDDCSIKPIVTHYILCKTLHAFYFTHVSVCVQQSQMVREQRAHQAAVVKFLAEMEARNKLQLDCNKLMVRV